MLFLRTFGTGIVFFCEPSQRSVVRLGNFVEDRVQSDARSLTEEVFVQIVGPSAVADPYEGREIMFTIIQSVRHRRMYKPEDEVLITVRFGSINHTLSGSPSG
jgi:hypothetical protein